MKSRLPTIAVLTRFTSPAILGSFLCAIFTLGGCQHANNPTPPLAEDEVLTQPIQLTHGFQKAGEAYFSTDMQWIIFQATTKPDEDYLMYIAQTKRTADGEITGINTPIRISAEGSWNSCGFFSPDTNSLIFSSSVKPREKAPHGPATNPTTKQSYRWVMPAEAEIYRADGWKGAIAALPPGTGTNLAVYPLTHNTAYDAECGLSPDGKSIVYCSNVTGDPEIWAMNADGSKPVQLTHSPGYDGGPFFSPDGKRIVYRSDRRGNSLLQIFIADLTFDTEGNITGITNEKQLTNDAAVNWGPYWHPDNRHLIWATSIHGQGNFELYLMRDDGTRKTRVTFTQGFDGLPVFSPNGKYLMWTSSRGPEKTSQIWLAKFKMPRGS